jgi:anthranilate phosphoribosyltransferase
MHAPLFHPAMKFVGPVRKSLKVKSFFNLLGPMINPSRPKNQMIGVYNRKVQDLIHQVYKELDMNYFIIYSLDGYDEISLTNEFRSVSEKEDKIYHAEMLKMHKTSPDDLFGGSTVEQAASIFTDILDGKGTKSQVNVVLANSAFAIQCYHQEKSLEEALDIARESLESKKALKTFKKLIEIQ